MIRLLEKAKRKENSIIVIAAIEHRESKML